MLIRILAAGLFLVPAAALAQQRVTPEIQAASQMLQHAQAQEFALRVEVASLRAENEKLKAMQTRPGVPEQPKADAPAKP